MEPQPQPIYYTRSKDENFFRKRYTATVSFAIGLLLFLLPFVEIRCGSVTLMNNTGIGIVTGSQWKVPMGGNKLLDNLNSNAQNKNISNKTQSGPNVFLLIAIAAAIFGLCVVLFRQEWKHIAGMCAGILCCIMFIAVIIQFNVILKSSMAEGDKLGGDSAYMSNLVKVKFTIWYYSSFIAFAAAAFFNYKHYKIELQDAIDRLSTFDFQQKRTAEINS